MKRETKLGLGIALVCGGLLFVVATYTSGPVFIHVPDSRKANYFGNAGTSWTERDAAYQRRVSEAIGKEMVVGGGIAAVGLFLSVMGFAQKPSDHQPESAG